MSQQVMDRPEVQEVPRWRKDAVVVAVAGAASAATWAAVHALGVDLAVRAGSGTQHVGLAATLATALLVSLTGAGLLHLLERRTPDGLTVWTVLAAVVWAASMVGPLGARSLEAGLGLAALHLVVGAVVLVGLRLGRRRELA